MKAIKTTILLAVLLVLTTTLSNAQNQSFWVHEDQVKPSKRPNTKK